MSDDVKTRIKEQLDTGAGLSSADIGAFAPPANKKEPDGEPAVDPMDEDSEVPVTEAARNTPAQVASRDKDPASKKIAETLDRLSSMFEEDLEESITITAAEKQVFLDTIVSGKRFELPFSLFNGKLKGRFRNRTNRESDAVMIELNRKVISGDVVTDVEYSTALRCGLMAFHVAQLGGEEHAVPEEPLTQVRVFKEDESEVVTPTWMDAAINHFSGMHDGVIAALYRELLRFERKYWLMVKHANNQNFWKPEDYTSA